MTPSRPVWTRRPVLRWLGQGLLGAGLLPTSSWALPGVDEPPAPGRPRPLVLPRFEETTLGNGLRVIVAPRPGLPLVTMALHLGTGALADPAGQTGLADLTHELRTRGALHRGRALDATDLARRVEALGSGLHSATNWRGSALSLTVATSHLDTAAELLADVIRRPTLPARELTRVRERAIDGLKFEQADPSALAGLIARRVAWGRSAYAQPQTRNSLERIHHADVLAQHQRQARPHGASLVFTGDISLPQALLLARRHWGDWRAHGPTPTAPPPQVADPTLPSRVLLDLPGAGQSGVVVLAPMPVGIDDPQRRIAQVAAEVLGGSYSARINQEVRIKRGLSYGASAGLNLYPEGGVLVTSTQTSHRSAAEVEQVMREEILRLAREAPTPTELAARQAGLVGGFARQLDTTAGLASLVIDRVERQRPLNEVGDVVPAVLAVTAQEVQDFAARYWHAAQLRTVIVGDLEAAGTALSRDGAWVGSARQLRLDAATLR